MPDTIEIRPLTLNDLPQVAEIHLLAFPKSALTRLGKETVRRYYEWQVIGPHDLTATGAFVDGQMAGFCFAGMFNGAIIGFLRRNKFYLVWQGLTHFWLFTDELFRSRARRGIELFIRKLFVRTDKSAAAPHTNKNSESLKQQEMKVEREFGILSIAVDPRFQGKGIGKALMVANEQIARQRGFPVMGLNVATGNQQAIRFYQSLGWDKTMSDRGDWQGKMKKFLQTEEPIC